MKSSTFFNLVVTAYLALSVSSCSVIGGIFKTGMGVGVFIAVAVIVIIAVIIIRAGKKSD